MSDEMTDLVFDEAPVLASEPEPAPVPEVEPEAPEAPEPEAEAEPEVEPEKPKNKPGSQKWRERAERNREEAEHWKAIALSGKPAEAPKPIQTDSSHAPSQDQYETHAEWVEALTDWKLENKLKEREAREQSTKIQQSWETKKAEARQELPDFDDVIADMDEAPAPVVLAVMNESAHTAKIAYHLAQHPEDLRRINRLSPPAAALEVARIEARFDTKKESAPATKPVSKAPRPPSPVNAPSAPKPSSDGRLEVY